jgi:hypothetical protein
MASWRTKDQTYPNKDAMFSDMVVRLAVGEEFDCWAGRTEQTRRHYVYRVVAITVAGQPQKWVKRVAGETPEALRDSTARAEFRAERLREAMAERECPTPKFLSAYPDSFVA